MRFLLKSIGGRCGTPQRTRLIWPDRANMSACDRPEPLRSGYETCYITSPLSARILRCCKGTFRTLVSSCSNQNATLVSLVTTGAPRQHLGKFGREVRGHDGGSALSQRTCVPANVCSSSRNFAQKGHQNNMINLRMSGKRRKPLSQDCRLSRQMTSRLPDLAPALRVLRQLLPDLVFMSFIGQHFPRSTSYSCMD